MELRSHISQGFHLLQFTDLHLLEYPWNENDEKTLIAIRNAIRQEKPDLAVFTGDMIWAGACKNPWQSFEKFIDFCATLPVPLAFTYGNHDTNHTSLTRTMCRQAEKRISRLAAKKHVQVDKDRESYVLEVFDSAARLKWAIFIIDSGGYTEEKNSRYEWILPSQIEWLKEVSTFYESIVSEAILIQHIPFIEFKDAFYADEKLMADRCQLDRLAVDSPFVNTGLFSELLQLPLISSVFVGHNHNNNFFTRYKGKNLVFGQVSGYSAKTQLDRGYRSILLSDQEITSFPKIFSN